MTFEDALQKLEELDVEFSLTRNKYAYGDVKRGWTCSIGADTAGKNVSAYGFGGTSSEACIEAVTRFFEVQSSGIPLASLKKAVPVRKTTQVAAA